MYNYYRKMLLSVPAVSDCQHHQLVLSHHSFVQTPLSTFYFSIPSLLLIAMLTSKFLQTSVGLANRYCTNDPLATAVSR